ncbi:MAG: alpha/beta hydrolase, partial [Bacteroidales bacterium]|nr:alpha/beta hydrolase [Bacteroidales bacterium]
VYAPDHRGHGQTAGDPEKTGYFADKNGWWKVVEDLHQIIKIAKNENPDQKVFLLGHSMGSFLSRTYVCKRGPEIQGLILSGTGKNPNIVLSFGRIFAKIVAKLKGANHRSIALDKLSFEAFNKNYNSPFQWLSRDKAKVDEYIADPYCGKVFTPSFFLDLFEGLKYIANIKNLKNIPKDLPIFIVSGDDDPVGNYGKGVKKVFGLYEKAGLKNLEMKLYEGARHEILNETNREEVYADILNWLNQKNSHAK